MSNWRPIPEKFKDEFLDYMGAADNDDLPDDAWWAVLEDAAGAFMKEQKLKGEASDAVHQYLVWRSEL